MRRSPPTSLGYWVQRFFEEYLPTLRGMSLHTIRSYRDAIMLLLRFMVQDTRRHIETLTITDLIPARVEKFLMSLERERHIEVAPDFWAGV